MGASRDALLRHIELFAGDDGYVSFSSIVNACMTKFAKTKMESIQIAFGSLGAAMYTGVKGARFHWKFKPEDAVGVMNHPGDTGLFSIKGAFNETQWNNLIHDQTEHWQPVMPKDKIIVDTLADGSKVVFASKMKAFNEVNQHNTERWKDAGPLFRMLGKFGNTNEFEGFFQTFTSVYAFNTASGKMERAIYLQELKDFYLDGKSLTDRVERGELPVKPPVAKPAAASTKSIFDKLVDCAVDYSKGVVRECPSYFPEGHLEYWQNSSSMFKAPVITDAMPRSGTASPAIPFQYPRMMIR